MTNVFAIRKSVVLHEITLGYPAREVIRAEHHIDSTASYRYRVRIIHGPYDGTEFHCRTKESVLWLYDHVVLCRINGHYWDWLEIGRQVK